MSGTSPLLYLIIILLLLRDVPLNTRKSERGARLSKWVIPAGIVAFIVGVTVVYFVLDDETGKDACWKRGGVPVQAMNDYDAVCLDPSVLR